MEMARKVQLPVQNMMDWIQNMVNRNRRYYEMYNRRAIIWSIFTPFIMAVPGYLFLASFDHFNFTSIIQFILGLFLYVAWIAFPGIFLYVNASRNKWLKIWFWFWLGLSLVSPFVWLVLF